MGKNLSSPIVDKNQRVVIVDVETTGYAVSGGGRVIEIGAVAIEDGRIAAEFGTLINTGADINWGAQQVHGISVAMLRGKPTPDQVWPHFAEFVQEATLVAHNASFDRAFVEFETDRLGLTLRNPWECTLRLARRNLPQLHNHKLATVAEHLLGDWPRSEQQHRALGDARVTAQIWLALSM